MPDLTWLARLGDASIQAIWLPVAAWSFVAVLAEAGVRLGRAEASLALPVRGAVLAALPLSVAVPAILRAVAPETASAVAGLAPGATWLPGIDVGAPALEVIASGPSPVSVALGLAVVVAGVLAAVRLVQFGRAAAAADWTRRHLPDAQAPAQAAVDAACRRLDVARPVRAAQAPAGAAPFTVGWRAPMVALPPDLAPDALDVAAVHEVAHVRRSDYAWHAAQRAVTSAFAAHPLVWVLGRGLDLDRERAADAAVLAACPDRRRAYADLLFSYAARPAPALALGASCGASSLKQRIDAMTRHVTPTHTRRLAWLGRAAGLLALTAVVAVTTAMGPSGSPRLGAEADRQPVERLFLHTTDGAPSSLELWLDPGSTRAHAEAVAAFAASDRPDAVALPLQIHFDDGVLRRDIRMDRGRTSFGDISVVLGQRTSRSPRRDTTDVFDVAEVMPEIIGGVESLADQIVYPELQRRAGVQGTTIVRIVVSAEGEVTDAEVARSSGNDGLDRAAVEAVEGLRFVPGRQDGQAVRVRYMVPVAFRLPADAASRPAPAGRVGAGAPVRRSVPDPDDPDVFGVAEVQPELIGGAAAIQPEYPLLAREAGIEGRVIVQFIVDEQGRVQDAVVVRSPHDMLSEAALATVRELRFTPGQNAGQPVRVRFALPITFRLPAGDAGEGERQDRGDDRPDGSRLDRPAPERPARARIGYDLEGNRLPVRYAGVDVSRLSPGSQQAFTNTFNAIPKIYGQEQRDAGDVEVRYVTDDQGRSNQLEYVRGDRSMMPIAAFLVGTMELAPDARPGPGGSSPGMLRVWYLGER